MSFEFTNEKNNNNDSQRHYYKYNFNSSLPLCKPTYLKLCGISDFVFLSIQTHLQTDGLKERIHRNTGHAKRRDSKVYLDLELTSQVKEYLIQYTNINGLPSPMRHRNDTGNFIYLPCGENFTSIYNKYKVNFYIEHDENEKVISYDTFKRLWYRTVSNIKFQLSGSDLCEVCEDFRKQIQTSKNNYDEFIKIKTEYEEHRNNADLERNHYNDNIKNSKINKSTIHICYDWA